MREKEKEGNEKAKKVRKTVVDGGEKKRGIKRDKNRKK